MDKRTSKLLLIAGAVYIVSQVVLVATVGKDIELIVLSLGVFIAAVLLIIALQNISFGRANLESVSMRRANQSREKQVEMMEHGYGIDKEFLSSKSFGSHAKAQMSPTFGKEVATGNGALFPKSSFKGISDDSKTGIQSIESAILANAPLYGGIDKLHEASQKMDDKAIESLVMKMGYKNVSATEVREVIITLVEQKISNAKAEATQPKTSGLSGENGHPKVSLDSKSFNDYIRRCMAGSQEPQSVIFIDDNTDLNQRNAASTLPVHVLRRMRGIRISNGGKMKCENCTNLDRSSQMCRNANLPVENTNVCDAWQPASPAFE